jgi:hypothetical protein
LKRYDNFVKTFGFKDELVQKHKKRFDILDNFFYEYNNQVVSYQFGNKNPSGYCGVIEILLYLIKNKKALKKSCLEPENYSHDQVMRWFFDGLASELS